MSEKDSVRKAVEAICNGNATGLKKYVKEALFSKVKKALAEKEKEFAKTIMNNATKK